MIMDIDDDDDEHDFLSFHVSGFSTNKQNKISHHKTKPLTLRVVNDD